MSKKDTDTTATTEVVDDRTPAPDGEVYLADVMAVVRRYADRFGWCPTAESVTLTTLNEGLRFVPEPVAPRGPGRSPSDKWCCRLCDGDRDAYMKTREAETRAWEVRKADYDKAMDAWRERRAAWTRFTPVEGTPPTVSKGRLKAAIRKANEDHYGSEQRALYRTLIRKFGLADVAEPVSRYKVTVTADAGLSVQELARQVYNYPRIAEVAFETGTEVRPLEIPPSSYDED